VLEEGIYRFSVVAETGEVFKLLRPVPSDSPWGVLSCLQGTPFEEQIPVVSGEDMSQALHGRVLPLAGTLGREPKARLKKLEGDWTCTQIKDCLLADRSVCFPNRKMPHCYSPPEYSEAVGRAVATVLQAWADDRYVVVVAGPEFSW